MNRTYFTLGLIIVLGLMIRCLYLGHDNLWMDEINTLIVATNHGYPQHLSAEPRPMALWVFDHLTWQPIHWPTLMDMLRQNVHLPLYYVLLNPWLGWLKGPDGVASEVALRSFSVVFSTLGMVALVAFAKDLFPKQPRAWLATAALAAFNPMLIYYAQEGRMYALALFLSTLSLWMLWRLIHAQNKQTQWQATVLYTLITAFGLLTHYVVWFQLPVHALGWLWALKKQRRTLIGPMSLAALVLGGLLLWALPMVTAQKSHLFATEKHFSAGLLGWDRYLTALIWQPLMVFSGSGTLNKIISITLLSLISLVGLFGGWTRHNTQVQPSTPNESETNPFPALLIALFIPLLFQIAVDMVMTTHTVTIVRYTLLISPVILLLLAGAITYWPHTKRTNALLILFALIGFILAIGNTLPNSPVRSNKRFQTEPFTQQLTQHITSNKAQKPIIIANGTLASPCTLAYYLRHTHPDIPMLFYVQQYQGQPTYDLNQIPWGNYDQAVVFNYRGGAHRGLTDIETTLNQAFAPPSKPNRILTYYP